MWCLSPTVKTNCRHVPIRGPRRSLSQSRWGCLRPLLTDATWAVAASRRPPQGWATSLRYNSLYSRLAPLLQLPTSLPVDISLLLCPAHTSTGFYVLYLWWVYVSSTSPSNLILITLLQFLCHRDAHLDFGETAQNDPMVKRLQTSFIRKLERCQQIEAWSGFTVQGLGTAWIVFFFSCLCSKISVNFSSSTTLY